MSVTIDVGPPACHRGIGSKYSAEQTSSYYLELERLLDRVERSTSHYEILGVERSANSKQIELAYREDLVLLHPPSGIKEVLPKETLERIERAFEQITRSFNVLANFGKRIQYDNTLLRRVYHPVPVEIPQKLHAAADKGHAKSRRPAESPFPDSHRDDDRRRSDRYALSIPARVTGYERMAGKWQELAQTINVSAEGVALRMGSQVRHGSVVQLILPLPVKLRSHRRLEESYTAYAVVRRVEPRKNGISTVGLEFLGEQAPIGYSEKPWAIFRIGNWQGTERRREPRHDRAEVVGIEYLSETMRHIRQEVALTENISPSGARVYLKAAPPGFNLVKVTNLNRTFEALAAVRNRFVGEDGFERLCLRFMDHRWPV